MPCSTASPQSAATTSKPPSKSSDTPTPRSNTSSVTPSATPPPTPSCEPCAATPKASPAPKSTTSSAATPKPPISRGQALGLLDPNDLLRAVDMLDLEPDHLAGAQAAAV